MTSFLRLSGVTAITLAAALSMTAGLAIAADNNVSADQILNALQTKPLTRGLSVAPPVDPSVKAREISFVGSLRNRKTRSLSMGEREEISEIALAGARCHRFRNSARRSPTRASRARLSWSPATPMRSAASPTIRNSANAAPIPSSGTSPRIRHQRHRSDHSRLRQDQADRSERTDGPDQPPRPGRQYQDRVEVNVAILDHLPASPQPVSNTVHGGIGLRANYQALPSDAHAADSPSYALRNSAISSLTICSMACIARSAPARSGPPSNSPKTAGTICQYTP